MQKNRYNSDDGGMIPVGMSSRRLSWGMARCTFYMDDPRNDQAVNLETEYSNGTTLWKLVKQPPIWLNTFNNWQAAWDDLGVIGTRGMQSMALMMERLRTARAVAGAVMLKIVLTGK